MVEAILRSTSLMTRMIDDLIDVAGTPTTTPDGMPVGESNKFVYDTSEETGKPLTKSRRRRHLYAARPSQSGQIAAAEWPPVWDHDTEMLGEVVGLRPRPLAVRARHLIDEFDSWSLSHVGREENADADKLANQGMDAAALDEALDQESAEQSSFFE